MTIALVDNGSLEPAAHLNLRRVAAEISSRVGHPVHAVSWRHSDRIAPALLDGRAAPILRPFLREAFGQGEREFVLIPFFISPQGAIGSALREELELLQRELGALEVSFTAGLAASDAIAPIVASRVSDTIAAHGLHQPAVIVVDHGGPSPSSAALRDDLAARIAHRLGSAIGPLRAASMEGAGHPHNQPLLATQLAAEGFNRGDVVIAPLFLSPGRHAGPSGDLSQIAQAAISATEQSPAGAKASPTLRCHFTDLIGSHPLAVETLAVNLRATLASHNRRTQA